MKDLSKAEETFLIAIWRLKDNAYGVTVREKINDLTGKMYTYGTLYSVLDQIVHRGYVTKNEGEPGAERGGRRKMFYRLTPTGLVSLKNSLAVQKSVWDGINETSLEDGLNV